MEPVLIIFTGIFFFSLFRNIQVFEYKSRLLKELRDYNQRLNDHGYAHKMLTVQDMIDFDKPYHYYYFCVWIDLNEVLDGHRCNLEDMYNNVMTGKLH